MSAEPAIEPVELAERPELTALRTKIGWICHSARIAALFYAGWTLYLVVAYWTDGEAVKRAAAHFQQGTAAVEVSALQQAAGLGVNLADWGLTAMACYSAWRLFTAYLSGSILTPAAALWLRRTASYGLMAQLLAIAVRPLISVILTLQFPPGHRMVSIFFLPNDLLVLLLLAGLLALAHVQKTAAEIAREHREFV